MADWAKIEAEYITTETSYRKLAQKYGLNQATIAQRAKAEDWVSKRKRQASATQALILKKDLEKKADRATRLMTVADKLLNKVDYLVSQEGSISAGAIKNLSDALRNIKDAQMIRSSRDDAEQDARIAKLRKEAVAEDIGRDMTIIIEGGDPSWQG